jgi:quinol monooxygenase YgiN
MIYVIATLELKPGTRDAFLAEFKKIIPTVRAEAGCIEYAPAVDTQTGIAGQFMLGPDRLTVIEKWRSVDELKAHDSAAHMQVYRARVKDYVRGREVRMLSAA